MLGVLFGLAEGLYLIVKSRGGEASFAEAILLVLSAAVLYTVLGGGLGLGLSLIVAGLAKAAGRFLPPEAASRLSVALFRGLMLASGLFLCLKVHDFLSVAKWLFILLWLAAAGLLALAFIGLGQLAGNLSRAATGRPVRLTLILLGGLILAWGAMFFLVSSKDAMPAGLSARGEGPNVVLITIDTLRGDRLGCYGYKPIKTPVLDKLAAEGTLFEQHIVQQPITTASHAAIFTAMYPATNGVEGNCVPLRPSFVTLAEILQDHGYATGAFVSAYPLKAHTSGLDQGFHHYDDRFWIIDRLPGRVPKFFMELAAMKFVDRAIYYFYLQENLLPLQRRGNDTTAAASRWLERLGNAKFFLWVHYFDPHAPYDPPAPYDTLYDKDYRSKVDGSFKTLNLIWDGNLLLTPEDRRRLEALYDGEITYTDNQVGILLEKLKNLKALNNTIIVITSDHGESLGKNNYFYKHGDFLYDDCLRVPLIIRLLDPATAGQRIVTQTESIDIAPTILEVLGIPPPPAMQGQSLLSLMRGQSGYKKEFAYSQAVGKFHERIEQETWRFCLRTPQWKFIHNEGEEEELYKLDVDPHENDNLIGKYVEDANRFRGKMAAKRATLKRTGRNARALDKDTREKLKNLGYIN